MKIFFAGRYNQSEILTGPEKAAKRLFSEYAKKNNCTFIEYFFDGRIHGIGKKLFGKEKVADCNGSPVMRLGLFALLSFLMKEKPTTIHIVTYERFTLLCLVYKMIRKVKVICGFQGNVHYENVNFKTVSKFYEWKDFFAEKLLLKLCDRIFFLSEASASISSKYHKYSRSKVEIVPNGVDEEFHAVKRQSQISGHNELRIVFVGDINRKEKGFEFLRASLSRLNIPFKVYLPGNDGPVNDGNYVCMPLMSTGDFAEFLSDKDVFISASNYEPFSIAAAEGMAAGVLPVVTKDTGMSRYISHGVNGYIFSFGNEKELCELIEIIHSGKPASDEIALRSRLIFDEISWGKVLRLYKKHYA